MCTGTNEQPMLVRFRVLTSYKRLLQEQKIAFEQVIYGMVHASVRFLQNAHSKQAGPVQKERNFFSVSATGVASKTP